MQPEDEVWTEEGMLQWDQLRQVSVVAAVDIVVVDGGVGHE